MSKYINNISCPECDEYIEPYGCTNMYCPIRVDYEEGMAADEELARRKDDRMEEELNK